VLRSYFLTALRTSIIGLAYTRDESLFIVV
jgi:hypothetical protein